MLLTNMTVKHQKELNPNWKNNFRMQLLFQRKFRVILRGLNYKISLQLNNHSFMKLHFLHYKMIVESIYIKQYWTYSLINKIYLNSKSNNKDLKLVKKREMINKPLRMNKLDRILYLVDRLLVITIIQRWFHLLCLIEEQSKFKI